MNMEGLQKAYNSAVSQAHESAAKLSSYATAAAVKTKSIDSSSSSGIGSSSIYASDQPQLLLTRPPRSMSIGTCSKLCAICFVAGAFFGYTLKRRVRRWASKLLKKFKDD